ncbi:glycosyltransferase family 4 protein [uncultured Thermanaerothrix sp.]|uniref:glycosyltransferase family 4 protein n=1 Tax=uncultured Thermanaerothrix sp. TaxID=1195149 RepID=UPI00262298CA|nr:glycosyltransferase family 4 protein [uncultured Thermanaerothrix sp.]
MRIAIFDYEVVSTNPVGSCHLRMLEGLCKEHEFTVFAVEFENPCPESIRFVRIPVPTRPLVLLFIAYHLVAPVVYLLYRLSTGTRFELIQMVESNVSFGSISYTHFCHRAYLRHHWKQSGGKGLRAWLRYLDHWLHALVEPRTFRRVRHIVVASRGLKQELEETYPFTHGKVTVISNHVELSRMARPAGFDRERFRRGRGASAEDVVFAFVALGHFDRKGLALVLDALRLLADSRVKLWVVGGEPDLVAAWQARVQAMGLAGQVTFWGMQRDVRPFLWGADAFIFPSIYEGFPLVSLEAAAAGLPLIVTPVHGVEEFMRDGEVGFIVEHCTTGVLKGIQRFLALPSAERERMGARAQNSVARYSVESFLQAWRAFYERAFLG